MSEHETVTPHPGANTAWHRTSAGEWLLVGMIGGEDYQSSRIVAIDIARQLAQTTTGKVRHVPGYWPADIILPAMRAPVREWVEPENRNGFYPALAAYLTENVGGTWDDAAMCRDLLPGVTLDAGREHVRAFIDIGAMSFFAVHPAVRDPKSAAEALRDLPALRAWLLAELDAARAVVGGAK